VIASSRSAGLLLAILVVAGCGGHASLGGACDGGSRQAASGGAADTGGTTLEAGGGPGNGGTITGSGGVGIDASAAGGAPGSGGAPSDGGSGRGGMPGDASTGGSSGGGASSGGATSSGGASSGGTKGTGGATSGGAASDASVPRDGADDGGAGLGQACLQSSDCSANAAGCDVTLGGCACDALSHTCVRSHCFDHAIDAGESDVDCGGFCDRCSPGEKCGGDADCSLYATGCDVCMCDRNTATCVHDHCVDHKLDVDETDVDCGGSKCSECENGKLCRVNSDCVTSACDPTTHRCVSDQCADHRKDGAETDVDCGGGVCPLCGIAKHCSSNFDCVPGHFCNGTRICQ